MSKRGVWISVLVVAVGGVAAAIANDNADLDGDGDVDLEDFALWQLQITGPCNCDATDPCASVACVNGSCVFTPIECPVGQHCENGACVACKDDPDCDDGFSCTADTCNLDGSCTNTSVDAWCNDGLFCTGTEMCDPADADADADGCVSTGDPCGGLTPICNEGSDQCDICNVHAECDDSFSCTNDTCEGDGSCTNATVDANCADPDFCDGVDVCDPTDEDADAEGCVPPGTPCVGGTPVCDEDTETCSKCVSNADCDDGFSCTDDTCDGGSGICTSFSNDANCDNGQFCTANDVCDPDDPDAGADGCVNDTDPCPPKVCNEANNTCDNCTSNSECDDGVDCTDDTCNGTTGDCVFTDNCTGGLMCLGGADPTICD